MSQVIQKQGMVPSIDRHRSALGEARGPARLFSSALFCLWLSTASLMVWVDFGRAPAEQVAAARTTQAQPAPSRAAATTDAIQHH